MHDTHACWPHCERMRALDDVAGVAVGEPPWQVPLRLAGVLGRL